MSTSRARWLPINTLVGVAFALSTFASFVQRSWLEGSMWGALAIAFLTIGSDQVPWPQKSAWRRVTAVLFLLLGIVLLAADTALHWHR